MQPDTGPTHDIEALRELNREYIEAVRASDTGWFRRMLTDDFRCSLPDGSLVDKDRFLERVARPLDISQLEVHDVEVRTFGDTAIIHARTTFVVADGRAGSGRYTDVWARHGGAWRAAAAHFTRVVS
jgi:ketosteroid isomerase-like protein